MSCCQDRKSTRLNSSHMSISYAVFCLKKKIATEETTLVIKDRLAGVNLFSAAFPFDHRIDKALEFFARPAIDAKPIQWVCMHETDFSRNSARQTGLKHCLRFGQSIGTNHSCDMQTDF